MNGEGGAVNGKPHVKLEAWKFAMDLVEEVYRVTSMFPPQEQYGLVSQMRRAAVSIPSNLAEGAGRDGNREFSRFLSIARGSLSELDTQYQIAVRLGYAQPEQSHFEHLLERTSKLIFGLHKKMKEAE